VTVTLRRISVLLVALGAIAVVVVARSKAVQPLGPQRTVVRGPLVEAADPVDAGNWELRKAPHPPLMCVSARRSGYGQNAGSCERAGRTWATARWIEMRVPRTLVMGYAAPGVRRVTVSGPGGARTFELTRAGRTFLTVFAGRVSVHDLAVVATTAEGRHETLSLGPTNAAVGADPHHGRAWLANAFRFHSGPRRGQTCVQLGRVQPRFGPLVAPGASRPICSDITGTDYFFEIVRMQGQTVLTGVAKPAVRAVMAKPLGSTAPGGRRASIERRSGAFILVFDGAKIHTDGLVVTIKTKDRTVALAAQRAMNVGFREQVPADLLRNAQSGKGGWLYHGVRISNNAAARHHLTCSSEVRVCDDSMSKLLAYLLHQGTVGGRYVVPDSNVCPLIPFGPLPANAGRSAAAEVLRELPALYGDKTAAGARVIAVAPATRSRDRGGYARVKCGMTAWRRSLVVQIEFPAMLPSASMSQGTVLVGNFWGQLRVWARLH
jgi:hypothetical protein